MQDLENNTNQPQPELQVYCYSQATLPTIYGEMEINIYHNNQNSDESIILYKGDLKSPQPLFVRIHSECFTSEVLGSLTCDCKDQLILSLAKIQALGRGMIIYLRQEGRGIGLGNKIRAYQLQAQGANTIEANHLLGFESDMRDYSIAAKILMELGIAQIELNTNNPEKISDMEKWGIQVVRRIPSITSVNEYNKRYLETKFSLLGHLKQSD